MSKYLLARVIMTPLGATHILMHTNKAVSCTPERLFELLSNSHNFIRVASLSYSPTSEHFNPQRMPFEDAPGLTLLSVYSDNSFVCRFPKLFEAIFETVKKPSKTPLSLNKYLKESSLSNEKHYFMQFFHEFTTEYKKNKIINFATGIEEEDQMTILRETFNTTFSPVDKDYLFEEHKDMPPKSTPIPLFASPDSADTLSVIEYAKKHNVTENTVREWIYKNKIPSTRYNNQYRIPADTPRPPDFRAGRSMPPKSQQGINRYLQEHTPQKSIELYAVETMGYSPSISLFFRKKEEVNYYVDKFYHEVYWNDRPCLIIDIQPDYVTSKGVRNRDLIADKKSPVVPDPKNEVEFDIHHVGQRPNSPFAIIPKDIHSSKDSIFHIKSAKRFKDKDLHGPEFQKQKIEFWNTYLEEYDKAKSFRNIDGTALSTAREKKRKLNRKD